MPDSNKMRWETPREPQCMAVELERFGREGRDEDVVPASRGGHDASQR